MKTETHRHGARLIREQHRLHGQRINAQRDVHFDVVRKRKDGESFSARPSEPGLQGAVVFIQDLPGETRPGYAVHRRAIVVVTDQG